MKVSERARRGRSGDITWSNSATAQLEWKTTPTSQTLARILQRQTPPIWLESLSRFLLGRYAEVSDICVIKMVADCSPPCTKRAWQQTRPELDL